MIDDNDQLKAASERMMAGYDELPADVRRAISNCLFNSDDVAAALSLYRSGLPAELIKRFIREAERRINSDGVMPKVTRGGFALRRRRGNKP